MKALGSVPITISKILNNFDAKLENTVTEYEKCIYTIREAQKHTHNQDSTQEKVLWRMNIFIVEDQKQLC